MKRFFTTLAVAAMVLPSLAQTETPVDTSWKKGGIGSVNFNQVAFSNWAAGGENSVSGAAFLTIFANYAKDRIAWDNQLDLAYGLLKSGNSKVVKSEDKIDLNSKLGYKVSKESKFYYTFLFNFKSQFANGYDYKNDTLREHPISRFLAPAYLLYSIGVDYKPNDNFSLYLSPLTGRTIIVNDDDLSQAGAFGVDPGKKSLTQLGAYLRAMYKKDVFTNVNFQTKLELFSNYLENPQNIAVNHEILIAMKVNKYLTANIGTQMIYDDIIPVTVIKETSGVKEVKSGPRLQFKEVFGIGLSYKF
ncbi:MAG TPA: DUF3078 domain-containing protein [Bacteroidia bacterium]|nr:MAG: hypothetical protein UZ10_BCD003001003 [Bacteroidetes bacterium OLB10]MBE7509128.1 DUF3078 domain-containing protein [Bacteroidia bacterium]MBX3105171.1 DUF3078 domain-containing protein [Bacteroidota bacterium]MCE7954457.1 DUF3078 domain-containing protein [Bacteroidetes bacterium CHB6]OQB65818.1 MAG: hypothetical protein BWX95_00101 [Bacteroidetes bacterium ADurb.Bin141]